MVRRKRQAKQPLLARIPDNGSQVEVVGTLQGAVLEHTDAAVLLNDELHRWIGRILNEGDGLCQTRGDDCRLDLGDRGRWRDSEEHQSERSSARTRTAHG
jgi:hypothetical protein